MPDPKTIFWAKLHRDRDTGEVQAIHPLADHGADVGACTEALLRTTLLRRRLARTGGLDDLSQIQIARLSTLATLHDLGKANRGFQNKALAKPPFTCGHVREAVNLLDLRHPLPDHRQLLSALDVETIETWADEEESTALRLLVAALCHHGRPWPIGNPAHCDAGWRSHGDSGRDPATGLRELAEVAKRGFPEAWGTSGELLPPQPQFQHAFSGLVMLADWLGSDEKFFPFRQPTDGDRWPLARERAAEVLRWIALDPRPARSALGSNRPGFDRVCEHSPRPAQARVLELDVPGETGEITVLEAETGSGKTEAALGGSTVSTSRCPPGPQRLKSTAVSSRRSGAPSPKRTGARRWCWRSRATCGWTTARPVVWLSSRSCGTTPVHGAMAAAGPPSTRSATWPEPSSWAPSTRRCFRP
jgi:CRISPR-associated endonuclease/helicase Cas3